MRILIELDVTNDAGELGVGLDAVSEALIEHAIEAVEHLGLSPKSLYVTGIKTSVAGPDDEAAVLGSRMGRSKA